MSTYFDYSDNESCEQIFDYPIQQDETLNETFIQETQDIENNIDIKGITIEKEGKENDEKREKISGTQQTNFRTNLPKFEILEKNEQKQLRGRKRQRSHNRKTHGKDFKDNMLDKNKSNIYHNSLEFVNILIGEKYGKLKILDSQEIITKNKQEKVAFLNQSLKELLSKKISPKYKKQKNYDPDYNKNIIDEIYKNENNESELIKVLDTTVKQMSKIYCDNKKDDDDIFKYFKRLDDDMAKLEQKDEEYKNKFKEIAHNFEEIINNINEKDETKMSKKKIE